MELVEDSSEINYQHLDSIILRVLSQVHILDLSYESVDMLQSCQACLGYL